MKFCAIAFSFVVGCASNTRGGRDLGVGGDDGGGGGGGDGGMSCMPDEPDQVGCACNDGPTRACWPMGADARARHQGVCQDGVQTCASSTEFATYGACTGAVLPSVENCANGVDDDCNGAIDCADAGCATNPVCQTGCTNGQMRPCYTGPSGTEGVGTCRAGMQTCTGGTWPSTCTGEVLPTAEDCTDAKDHNCNHLPGCLDLFSCVLSPACQGNCTTPDPMCVCPMGAGDTATCPGGTHGVTVGVTISNPAGMTECCPCTSGSCNDPACCAETVCAGNAACAGLTCKPLPTSCGGRVNADCDDFPEDCDEPCCPCTTCP